RGGNAVCAEHLEITVFAEAPVDLKVRHAGDRVHELVVRYGETEPARLLKHEAALDHVVEHGVFDLHSLQRLGRELAFHHVAIDVERSLVLHGEFALADRFAVDLGDFLRARLAKFVAAVKGDEDHDDDGEKKNDDPRSLPFAQNVEHEIGNPFGGGGKIFSFLRNATAISTQNRP